MKKKIILFTVLVVFMLIPFNVYSGTELVAIKKYALVIGNDNYTQFYGLNEAVKDAVAIAEGFSKTGFEVTLLTNATAEQMNNAIDTFAIQLTESPDSQGLFWFSGNGLQLANIGYLLGIDADNDIKKVRTGAVSILKIFEAINSTKNAINLIIVDACLNSLDDSEKEISIESTLLSKLPGNIGYIRSTSPGQNAADNSPFIAPVLKYLGTPENMISKLSAISRETSTSSRRAQTPIYYNKAKIKTTR
jgi:hypothetical protein